MTETFAVLLFAHVLADFVFQTAWMVERKRHPGVLLLHGIIVWAAAAVALGSFDEPVLAALAVAHIAIDAIKTRLPQQGLPVFLGDQLAHVLTVIAAAAWAPDLWEAGIWADFTWLPGAMTLVGGLILTTRVGGFAIGMLMEPWDGEDIPKGLPSGGRLIGLLERGLSFLLILAAQPAGIGFLIAAKSVLRFDATSKNQKAGEYVLVGTLASIGWAIAVSYATLALLSALPELGILPEWP